MAKETVRDSLGSRRSGDGGDCCKMNERRRRVSCLRERRWASRCFGGRRRYSWKQESWEKTSNQEAVAVGRGGKWLWRG